RNLLCHTHKKASAKADDTISVPSIQRAVETPYLFEIVDIPMAYHTLTLSHFFKNNYELFVNFSKCGKFPYYSSIL
ncbi:MAG: hypothetical protein IJ532_05355, partial [Alphaproteobacteria bacterium]|nr:hypothetical protein [Alphaproteobacteria bacterium]